MSLENPPILDGHNDTLTKIHGTGPDARSFLERSDRGHIDLPRAREGGLGGGFFAIFSSSPDYERSLAPLLDGQGQEIEGGWSIPLPPPLPHEAALEYTRAIVADLEAIVAASDGAVRIVRTPLEALRCLQRKIMAVILHIEGAEAIAPDLSNLDEFYELGLRSLGPVWSRPNAFAHGVPFDFPRSPDTGPGLSNEGHALIRRCNDLGILVDLSHLNEKGFWDVSHISTAPLVATHSAAHRLCPSPRNLTDEQLDVIGLSRGIVGINFHVGFLRSDGRTDTDTPLSEIVKHARYVADRIGVEHVGLGSDLDGATMPAELTDVSRLPALVDAFREAGFAEDEIEAIAYLNWLRVLRETWRGE